MSRIETVADLIEELQNYPQNARIYIDEYASWNNGPNNYLCSVICDKKITLTYKGTEVGTSDEWAIILDDGIPCENNG